MQWVVLLFLAACLIFYCVLGGADFGAGALEIFVPKKKRRRHEELVNKAMGPVWEANHIWLIILIVILFNGFPKVYTECSIYFHVPLTLMLIGIVLRGCAFTFRNYDAFKDNTHRYYSFAFSLSSILTPIMFGMIMGGMFLGVDQGADSYYQKYVASWFNPFSFSVGIFVLGLFSYLASVYLIGEAEDKEAKDHYVHCAQITHVIVIISGAMVFLMAHFTRHPLLRTFFTHPESVLCFVAAFVLALTFWQKVLRGPLTEWAIRLIAGAQVGLILLAWFSVIFPDVLFYTDGSSLSLLAAAAPPVTTAILGWSLIVGTCFFLPILYYLLLVFKITER
jgi:cytochrome d ubiquinol oxidase subunit II